MSTKTETESRAPEGSVQPSVSERGDPPEKRESIEKIAGMLDEFDAAYVEQLAGKLKEELNVLPPTEPPTNCDRAPTLAECKRIKALYPKIDLNHENLWYNVCDDFDATIGEHGWNCLLDVAEHVERWEAAETRKRNVTATLKTIQPFLVKDDDTPVATINLDEIRGRVNDIAAIVWGLAAVESTYRNIGVGKDEVDNYFHGACGIVGAAQRAISNLQEALGEKGGAF